MDSAISFCWFFFRIKPSTQAATPTHMLFCLSKSKKKNIKKDNNKINVKKINNKLGPPDPWPYLKILNVFVCVSLLTLSEVKFRVTA